MPYGSSAVPLEEFPSVGVPTSASANEFFLIGTRRVGRLGQIGVEDDLACSCREEDARERRCTRAHDDRESMVAEPGGESTGVAVEQQPCDLDVAGMVGCAGPAGKRGVLPPLDEEGERGLSGGPLDPGASPSQQLVGGSGSRAGAHGQAESSGNSVEFVRADRPAEQPAEARMHPRDSAPELVFCSLSVIDDGDQLEIGLAERHDPVGGAPAWVTAALDRSEAVPRLDLPCTDR